MSTFTDPPLAPTPRVVLVLAGAAGVVRGAPTALELASMPQLAGVAQAGRVGRLRTVAPHLPPTETSAAATSVGTTPPMALDPGAVAAESLGRLLGSDESCTVVEVLDLQGDPAPALDVERAASALQHQLRWQRVVGVTRGHQILLAGVLPPVLPELDGLRLRPLAPGFLPSRLLDGGMVVVAAEGSVLLGVAAVLGATAVAVDATRGAVRDPVPERLRRRAAQALIDGAHTVVVESRAPQQARRIGRAQGVNERAVAEALSMLDRELVGPLHTAASWAGACLSVTADLPRTPAGRPLRGDVPIVMTGPRSVFLPEPSPVLAPLGTAFVPTYCERAVERLPAVSSPHALLPPRDAVPPRRFTRDPATGLTARTVPTAA